MIPPSLPPPPPSEIPVRCELLQPRRSYWTTASGFFVYQTTHIPSCQLVNDSLHQATGGWLVDNGLHHVRAKLVDDRHVRNYITYSTGEGHTVREEMTRRAPSPHSHPSWLEYTTATGAPVCSINFGRSWHILNGTAHVRGTHDVSWQQLATEPSQFTKLVFSGPHGETRCEGIAPANVKSGIRYITRQERHHVLDQSSTGSGTDNGWIMYNGEAWIPVRPCRAWTYLPNLDKKGSHPREIPARCITYRHSDDSVCQETIDSNELFSPGMHYTVAGTRVFSSAVLSGGPWYAHVDDIGWVNALLNIKVVTKTVHAAVPLYRAYISFCRGDATCEERVLLSGGLLKQGVWRTESGREVRHQMMASGLLVPEQDRWKVRTSGGQVTGSPEVLRLPPAVAGVGPQGVFAVFLHYRLPEGFALRERAWLDVEMAGTDVGGVTAGS